MENDKEYYCRRAEEELQRAADSTESTAVKAHYQLANYYLGRAYDETDPAASGALDVTPGAA